MEGRKTGLILEGGAMRGLFTGGVMDVLMGSAYPQALCLERIISPGRSGGSFATTSNSAATTDMAASAPSS